MIHKQSLLSCVERIEMVHIVLWRFVSSRIFNVHVYLHTLEILCLEALKIKVRESEMTFCELQFFHHLMTEEQTRGIFIFPNMLVLGTPILQITYLALLITHSKSIN